MITFLSSPKPFTGIDKINQTAAIESWIAVHPDVEVILYGDSPGTEEICALLSIRYVPDIEVSASGVPFFNAIVKHAQIEATHDLQVYLNCDILLNASIADAARHIEFPQFLLVGQRVDLGESVRPDPSKDDILEVLGNLFAREQAKLHPPAGIDYFMFRRGMWSELPELVIGRAGYDSALIAHCLRQELPLIDATGSVLALHQFHDYGHVSGGKKKVWSGEDARRNMELHGVVHSAPNTADATWRLRAGCLQKKPIRADILRSGEMWLRFDKNQVLLSYGVRGVWRVLRRLNIYHPERLSEEELLIHLSGR